MPTIPEGYALTLGFACLLDICSSVELNILAEPADPDQDSTELHKAMITSSWCGALASLSLLLEARSVTPYVLIVTVN